MCVFHQFEQVFGHYFFNILSPETPIKCMLAYLMVSQRSLKVFVDYFFSFLFLKLISVGLSLSVLILSSAFSNLMLSLSSQFFVSALVLFFCQHFGVLLLLFLFVYFWLHRVSTPTRRLSLVAMRGWGPLFVVVHELLIAVAPLVGEHKF